ncbi:hypothetical protein KIN20_001637 [Parelaphostrongylus tenuis]|uniref:Uncharacterized protein n=1 Tax=Parelaphostrongylus tenuis TaxID=148309 RepID=A0AAD5MME9_PARTN|nr:hypothetical protein KIN20_001637 [Parelaphostrongylus tenuis]
MTESTRQCSFVQDGSLSISIPCDLLYADNDSLCGFSPFISTPRLFFSNSLVLAPGVVDDHMIRECQLLKASLYSLLITCELRIDGHAKRRNGDFRDDQLNGIRQIHRISIWSLEALHPIYSQLDTKSIPTNGKRGEPLQVQIGFYVESLGNFRSTEMVGVSQEESVLPKAYNTSHNIA